MHVAKDGCSCITVSEIVKYHLYLVSTTEGWNVHHQTQTVTRKAEHLDNILL